MMMTSSASAEQLTSRPGVGRRLRLTAAVLAAAAAGAFALAPAASAQQTEDRATAPDGSAAFGIDPYFGVMGGYHDFSGSDSRFGEANGWLIEGVVGANVPVGPLLAGVEGNVAYGFSDIDWEYGVRGRLGFRAGESGFIYGLFGRQWVNIDNAPDDDDWTYGVGAEVGPQDIGLSGLTTNAGVRLRLQVETVDFESLRPTAGVVFHF